MKGAVKNKVLLGRLRGVFLGSQPLTPEAAGFRRGVMSPRSTSRGNSVCSLVLSGKNPAAEAVGTVGNSPRFCFLRRVFQALWELVEKSLRDDPLPLNDFSTVSIARQ